MGTGKQTYLRNDLERMDSRQLNDLLQTELGKNVRDIDDDLVRLILAVLESREGDFAENKAVDVACEKYRAGCQKQLEQRRKRNVRKWSLRAASAAAAVLILLIAVPKVSGQNIFVEFITRITGDVVAFFNPAQGDNRRDYAYHTENPGLQQVYDAVSELGIKDPVVPSWLPDGYELGEIKTTSSPASMRVFACFKAETESLVLSYERFGMSVTHEYSRDETPVDKYECFGIMHEIYFNSDKYLVFWEIENLKCSIIADCQEDVLTEILDSIYMMEDA